VPTIQEFWKRLKSLLSLARLSINDRLSQLDLTSAAGDIIFHLIGEESGLPQEALCERLNIGKAAISRTVDSLVQKGYAQRAKHPGDARSCLVSLTAKGLGISARVTEVYDSVFRDIRRDIPEEDFVSVSLLLDRILHNLGGERPGQ
jgi:DNA-binding MarR family transcriptional regulator